MKLIALFIVCSLSLRAQQEEKNVLQPINQLFTAMKKGDSAMAHKTFHPMAKLFTVYTDKAGQPALRGDAVGGFLKAIGTPHKEVWNELIWSPKVDIDGNFAQVWVSYGFFVDKTFSHCGVDAFQLFKDGSGSWKIFHLADTRQKEGCVVPDDVKAQLDK